jgi:O-antigen ligase
MNGIEVLRAYGTFSHPNSLAGFYLLVYVFVLTYKHFEKMPILKYGTMFVSALLIFVSFSKIPIILFLFINFWYVVRNPQAIKCLFCRISRIVVIAVVSIIFLATKGDKYTLIKRGELLRNSLDIIAKHPLFGVGIGNYLLAQIDFPIKYAYFFLQPVHNIFLLFLSESGIILTVFVAYSLYGYFKPLFKNQTFQYMAFIVVTTGMFDHYWLTLQQNFLLLPLLFALL